MPLVEVRNVCKSYPDGWMMEGVGFSVEEGESLCLLGPSGCGKTTLLRLLAGLETPECGEITVNGRDISHVPPHLRGFGLMFQEFALFPHMDVFGNVAFGLRMQRLSHDAVRARAREVLELVGLAGFERRDVNQLSGGERQRVALARSLAPKPTLLMLDEPLGALDRAMRERLLDELPRILRQAGVTAITVTHDQEEAFAIADRVVLMREGRVVQVGAPEEVYRRPASAWVASFLGLTNLLEARILERGRVETALGTLQVEDECSEHWAPGTTARLLIRSEAVRPADSGPNTLAAVVVERSFRGGHYRLGLRHASGVELTFAFPAGNSPPAPGETLSLSLDPRVLVLLRPDDSAARPADIV